MHNEIDISDEELAAKAAAGSLSSFEALLFRYEARVYQFLLKCCRNEDDARELTQVTFVTAYQSLDLYDSNKKFTPWLYTIARRKFIDHCRKARHYTDAVPEEADTDDPSVLLQKNERERSVWDWVRSVVSDDQFQALWLYYQEQLSIRQIAAALDRSSISVKVMLFRAKRTLSHSGTHDRASDLRAYPAVAPLTIGKTITTEPR